MERESARLAGGQHGPHEGGVHGLLRLQVGQDGDGLQGCIFFGEKPVN